MSTGEANPTGLETDRRLPLLPPAMYIPLYPEQWKPIKHKKVAGHEDNMTEFGKESKQLTTQFPVTAIMKLVGSAVFIFALGYTITLKTR